MYKNALFSTGKGEKSKLRAAVGWAPICSRTVDIYERIQLPKWYYR